LVLETVQDFASKTDLLKVIKPAIASKQFGYEDFLSDLVVDAALRIMPRNPKSFNVDNVRVAKVLGGSVFDSALVNGMVFNREPEGQVAKVVKAKVAVFTCPLDISRTETKGTVLIHDAKEMLNFSHGEESSLETVFKQLHDAGVNVIVTSSAVADLALHFMQRHEMMVMKVLSKFDLRRLCRVTGATALARLGVPTAEEMGKCDVVEMVEIGSDRCTVFRQEEEDSKTVSIVIRGGTVNLLDDLERAIDDGVNTVKAVVKDSRLLAGAGAFEIELAKRLFSYGEVKQHHFVIERESRF
jgi:T-complex protein 1 subunit theta